MERLLTREEELRDEQRVAEACSRVLVMMRSGLCPQCGNVFLWDNWCDWVNGQGEEEEVLLCPKCSFRISREVFRECMIFVRSHMALDVELFNRWALPLFTE